MAFTEGQTATNLIKVSIQQANETTRSYGCTSGWGDTWIKGVYIKAEMDGSVALGINMVKGHFHNLANAVAIDFVHAEGLDVVFPQNLLLTRINIAQANINEAVRLERRLNPFKLWKLAP